MRCVQRSFVFDTCSRQFNTCAKKKEVTLFLASCKSRELQTEQRQLANTGKRPDGASRHLRAPLRSTDNRKKQSQQCRQTAQSDVQLKGTVKKKGRGKTSSKYEVCRDAGRP